MKSYRYILFDLDGTLTDPGLGITNSIMYALRKFNIEPPEREQLYKFIGPPLLDSFEKYCGFSHEEAVKAVSCYREYYGVTGIFENRVYDGIENLLRTLHDNGRTLLIATSKPEVYARRIAEHYGFDRYFSFIGGGIPDGTRTEKHEVIEYVLNSAGIADKSQAVMIGDRKFDILGAKRVGIDSIGVLYGYGDVHELQQAGADYIAENVDELLRLLEN